MLEYKVLVDTNIFFIPFYHNFDILNEIKKTLEEKDIKVLGFYTLRKNIWEVENKLNTAKSNKWKKIYKLVMEYIKVNNVIVIDSPINEKTDRLIVKFVLSSNDKWIVATQDRNLRYILNRLKISTIHYTNKSLHIKLF